MGMSKEEFMRQYLRDLKEKKWKEKQDKDYFSNQARKAMNKKQKRFYS